MANTNLVIDMVTKEVQRIAQEKLTFLGTIDLQYDETFKDKPKIGSTLRIRRPNQFTRRQGSRVMNVQDVTETADTLTVATQDGVDIRFNSQELTQDIEYLRKRYFDPAISVLISGIEGDVLTDLTKSVYNVAGTAGTPPADLVATGAARAKLNQYLAPKDGNRCVQFDSVTMGTLVNGLKGLFQDSTQIKEQYREGMVGRTAMADFYENERTYSHTNGADVVGAINQTAFTNGLTTLTIDGMSAAPTVGSVFTIDTVFAVHPETKQVYDHLQQFVVTSDTTPTTTAISFSPAIKFSTTDPGQNVNASPANNDGLTFVGSASTSYRHNLMYHKEFAAFVTADLPIMDDAHRCVRSVHENLALRVWQGSDIRNDELLMRVDILYGWKILRPDWACRITS